MEEPKDTKSKTITFRLVEYESENNEVDAANKQLEQNEENPPAEENTIDNEQINSSSAISPRQSVILQEMDQENAWLAEMVEKCANLETAFISKIQYVALSNHFQKYLDYLETKKEEMPGVHGEFAHLFEKFRTCFVGGQRLLSKVFELKGSKNVTNSENRKLKIRLQKEEAIVQELSRHLEVMRDDIVKMDKEKMTLQLQINNLKEELRRRLEQKASEEDAARTQAQNEKEQELKMQKLEEKLMEMRQDLEFGKKREEILQHNLDDAEKERETLQDELTTTKSDFHRKVTSLDKALEKISECNIQLEKEEESVKILSMEIHHWKTEAEEAKSKYKRILTSLKKCQKEFDKKCQAFDKLRKDFDIREDRIKLLMTQMDSLDIELADKQIEINSLKVDRTNILKQRNEYLRKIGLLEDKVSELELKVESINERNMNQQKELDSMEKEYREFENKIKELTKQKNSYLEELQKLGQIISKERDELKLSQEKEKALDKELTLANKASEKLERIIKKQAKTQEQMSSQILDLKKTIEGLHNEIKGLELRASDSQKAEYRLRQELEEEIVKYKTLLDDVRFYRKLNAEAKQVIEQQKEKLEILNKNILQLENCNKVLDEKQKKMNVVNNTAVEQLSATKESLKQEITNGEDLAIKIKYKDAEEQRLSKEIVGLENDLSILKRKLDNIMEERDALSSKLEDKDKMISDGKRKVKLLEKDVHLMEQTLDERVEDIKLLKIQLSEMYRNNALMEGKVTYLEKTRQELTAVQRELQDLQHKSKGMEEEMQRPINFHRWRILEGTDPDRAQLITKTVDLQKQLAKKTSDLEAKELELREKEQEAQKLQEMVQRRSERGVDDHLWDCKRELRARMDRLKCLTAENSMYESIVEKYRKETMTLRDELRKYKMTQFRLSKNKPKTKHFIQNRS